MIVTFKFWDEDDYEEEIFSILARVWNIISLAGKRDRFNYKLFLISFLGENEYFKRLNDLEIVANVRKISGVEGRRLYLHVNIY